MIGFCPLASGSKGNSTYLGSQGTKILIDVGLPLRQLEQRLACIGVRLDEIDAIIITHEHSDHIKGLHNLSSELQIPILCNRETAIALEGILEAKLPFRLFSTGDSFTLGDLLIKPFQVMHDTPDPVGVTIETHGYKVGICTDLGQITPIVRQELKGCDYLVLEANHDPNMVWACSRPLVYKQRVLSKLGHLSNEECARLLEAVMHEKLRHVHLAHLSSECNSGEKAILTVQEMLDRIVSPTKLSLAYQDLVSLPIRF